MIKKVAIILGGVMLAYSSGTASLATALASVKPAEVSALPLGAGAAKARLARMLIAERMLRERKEKQGAASADFPTSVNPRVIEVATAAYREEPLQADALSSLAIAYNARGENGLARSLFKHAHKLTRRDEAVSLWLALDAVRAGKLATAMNHFDELLRTSSASRSLLLQRLALLSSDPALRSEIIKKIRANPPWLEDFWIAGASSPPSAAPTGRLAQALLPTISLSEPVRQSLALNLLVGGNDRLAREIYFGLAGQNRDALVINSDFRLPTLFPPIDWQTYSTGDYSAEISTGDGAMYVTVTGYPAEVAARQFVPLLPGRYRLSATARLYAMAEGERMVVRLSCRLDSAVKSVELKLVQGQAAVEFAVPPACSGYFLDVLPVTVEGTQGFDAEITSISIVKI